MWQSRTIQEPSQFYAKYIQTEERVLACLCYKLMLLKYSFNLGNTSPTVHSCSIRIL